MRRTNALIFALVTLLVCAPSFAEKDKKHWGGKNMKSFQVSEEEIQQAISKVQEKSPKRYEKLLKLKNENPEAYKRKTKRLAHRMKRMQMLKEKNPKLYQAKKDFGKMRRKVKKLARQYRQAKTDKEKAAVEKQIDKALGEQFDKKLNMRKMRLEGMESRLGKMKKKLNDFKQSKSEWTSEAKKKILEGKSFGRKHKKKKRS